ncbi:MAG: MurR/RpiR family transcriptional regulator [Defluviitaleaceae bacterium]|nr:MurR/RpiR family transcriptional regulator [Defluviitaleaceae bacterium]
MNKWNKITELYPKFNKTQKHVADFFMQNAQKASGRTIEEIAERTGVSKATVVRFAKAVGFAGYRDFIMWFTAASAEEISPAPDKTTPTYIDVSPGDSIDKIMGHIYLTSKQSIDQTMEACDEQSITLAVERMHRAKRVDFFGMGAGAIIALDAQQKFLRINKISYAFSDSHTQATVASTLTPADVCVIISYSGETPDTQRIAEIAKGAGAYVVSITKYGDNSISRLADVKLFVSSPESEIRPAATGSRISQLCIIDILYTAVLSIEYDNVKQYLDASRRASRYKR